MKTLDNNIQIFQKGDSHNLPLIFVHGFPFDHQMWDKQIEHFSKIYFCITYDIRGLGISPVGDGQYTMESHVDDLFDVMEKLGVVKPVLCGLSMGGYIALRAVESVDGMTANWFHMPHDALEEISTAITNKVKGINRVVYDISNKPPSTIEWE